MNNLTREEKHAQCMREIKATLTVALLCCVWHVGTAFALNKTGWFLLGMPAWFTVSVFGTVGIAIVGVCILTKYVFIDFSYEEEEVTQ